ncbi:sodium:solute symporter family transporter [Tichowtungia aerotolerans]|uniref:Sodium/solute symporter n=1 Tax=Tichowtungia aerotolerans TaxID=2697043 RepID=A0A6P1M7R7_9BACT|nr:sodium/solute symporter [Tichowtungia aerotolerans]QHI69103.1 sodium/solute symporter [Tichowtungia aerotolerans]
MDNMHVLDLIVLVLYFGATLGLGLYFSKKNTDTEEYFLGGRSFPGWALGLSLVGTCMSSVTFIAYPADGFKTTLVRLTMVLGFPFVALFASYVLLPFFRRGTVTSAYEYLALRFGKSVSCYAAGIFFLMQILRVSSILYLVSLIIQSVTGLDFMICMLVSGGITAVYTVSGGFDAVIWTDVLQTITLVFGAFIMIGVVMCCSSEGFGELMAAAWEYGKMSFTRDLNTSSGALEPLAKGFSLSDKTFIMLLIVGVAQFLNGQFDQTSIQRWCSAKSAKEARKAILVLALSAVPIWAGFMFVGTVLWAFFHFYPDPVATEILNGVRKAEELVPYFVVKYVPPGWAGLVIAGAMAAAMSSLSSSINAASMVWVRDIYKPYIAKSMSDKHYLKVGFAASAAVSLLMLVGAYLFNASNAKTLNDLAMILGSVCSGGMLAVFLFGVFTRRGDSRSIWVALAANAVFVSWMLLSHRGVLSGGWTLAVDLYYSILLGNLLTFAVALLASRYLKSRGSDLTNLTVWDQEKTPLV